MMAVMSLSFTVNSGHDDGDNNYDNGYGDCSITVK